MGATFSPCGNYRYTLTRETDVLPLERKTCLFIMLNPSTADAEKDDPTIRRCISFAAREGCTDLKVVNLFALRATNPKELLTHEDPHGSLQNLFTITASIKEVEKNGGLIIGAWGAHPMAMQSHLFSHRYNNLHELKCLGLTKEGHPRHPLYVKNDAPIIQYPGWWA